MTESKGLSTLIVFKTFLMFFMLIPLKVIANSFGMGCGVEVLPELKSLVVSPGMNVNGVGQKVVKIESMATRQEIIKKYIDRWRSSHSQPLNAKVVSSGRWEIISKIIGSCIHTVQLDKNSYNASGYVSARELENINAFQQVDLGKGFPKLYGSKVLSDISFSDPGKKARTVMMANNFSIDANADFYLRNLSGDGWGVLIDNRVPMQKRNEMARVITFGKNHETNTVVISESKLGSNVVIQWMEKP